MGEESAPSRGQDYAREKREALDLWADRLAGIVGAEARVLPLKKAWRKE